MEEGNFHPNWVSNFFPNFQMRMSPEECTFHVYYLANVTNEFHFAIFFGDGLMMLLVIRYLLCRKYTCERGLHSHVQYADEIINACEHQS